jgi:hypothetical protein
MGGSEVKPTAFLISVLMMVRSETDSILFILKSKSLSVLCWAYLTVGLSELATEEPINFDNLTLAIEPLFLHLDDLNIPPTPRFSSMVEHIWSNILVIFLSKLFFLTVGLYSESYVSCRPALSPVTCSHNVRTNGVLLQFKRLSLMFRKPSPWASKREQRRCAQASRKFIPLLITFVYSSKPHPFTVTSVLYVLLTSIYATHLNR